MVIESLPAGHTLIIPALDSSMNAHIVKIESIVNCGKEPDFDNTIAALDLSGEMLEKVSSVFSGLYSAHGTDEMQAIAADFRTRTVA